MFLACSDATFADYFVASARTEWPSKILWIFDNEGPGGALASRFIVGRQDYHTSYGFPLCSMLQIRNHAAGAARSLCHSKASNCVWLFHEIKNHV